MNALAASQDTGGAVLGALFITWLVMAGIFTWLAPVIVAVARENRNRNQVIIVDLLTGWTGIGWVVALVMAFQAKPVPAPPPYQYAVQR